MGGIVDGRVLDAQALRAAVEEAGRAGLGVFQCEIVGGRFSLLPAETHPPAVRFGAEEQERFLAALGRIESHAVPGSIESTLHCRLHYGDEVVETLFVVRGGRFDALSRTRPAASSPAPELPSRASRTGLRRRDLLLATVGLSVLAAFGLWRSGLFERVTAARAETLVVDTGPFGATLEVKVERRWGIYEVAIQRGGRFPQDPAAVAALDAAATSLPERAAFSTVASGGDVWVLLCDQEGRQLAAESASLRTLIVDAKGTASVGLLGNPAASSVRLSLTAERRPEER